MWQVWGDTYNNNGELGSKSVKVRFNANYLIRTARTWVIVYNNPSLLTLKMEVYSDDGGSKKALLHTSTNTFTKAQILTEANGVRELYFSFDDIHFDANNWYHFVLNGTATSLSSSSTIAWKHSFPDPVYDTGLAGTFEELSISPYDIYFEGAAL